MQFRFIKEKDRKYLWSVYVQSMQSHIEKIWGWEPTWQKADFEKNLVKYTTSLITILDKTIGYIQYKVEEENAYINMLILEPTQQSQGLGGKVFNHLLTEYKLDTLSLRCFKVNTRAFDFYLREGFVVIEEDDNFYLLKRDVVIPRTV